jgi:hypothetical protein
MLQIMDRLPNRDCQGVSRRSFLGIGTAGLGALGIPGLSLPWLFSQRAAHASSPSVLRDRAVVLLFLQGGPPHLEFFDPKPQAPVEIRSVTGEIQTRHPGILFGGTFPRLAALADRFSVVRSYGSGNADHTYGRVVSGGEANGPSASAIYARVRGNTHPETGIPTNVLVLPEGVREGLKLQGNFETGALPTLTQAGALGSDCVAFNPSGGGQLKQDMELRLPAERLGDRRSLLAGLDALRHRADRPGQMDSLTFYQQQAFEVITRGVAQAFDWQREDPHTIARYDTTGLFSMDELTRWNDMRRASNLLGHQLLLARRLCEAGCGFVTVSDCGWDYHANGNSPKNMAGIYPMGGQVDHAVAAFIEDVLARGLQQKILLIVTGEMGRTPRLNGNGGRDHYGELTPLLLFGGGLTMGQVVGQSDGQAAKATSEPFRPGHLLATILNVLFDLGRLRLEPNVPRDILRRAEAHPPIASLGLE